MRFSANTRRLIADALTAMANEIRVELADEAISDSKGTMGLTTDQIAELRRLIGPHQDRFIDAIKQVRDWTGVDLLTAKRYVDTLRATRKPA